MIEETGSRRPEVRLGLLFLTRGDVFHPGIWERFLEEAGTAVSVFAHPKSPEDVATRFLREAVIGGRVATRWGHVSLVRAMLRLLEEAWKDGGLTHFAFVSESCVPIRRWSEMRVALAEDPRSRINLSGPEDMPSGHARRQAVARNVRFDDWRSHSQWVLLDRETAGEVLAEDRTADFEDVFAADEHYFGTVLAARGFAEERILKSGSTWLDRQSGLLAGSKGSPSELLAELTAGGSFFARKFPASVNTKNLADAVFGGDRGMAGLPVGSGGAGEALGRECFADWRSICFELSEFLHSGEEFMWQVDERTWLDGDWEAFFDDFDDAPEDLLALGVRDAGELPGDVSAGGPYPPVGAASGFRCLGAMMPVLRFSRQAAEAVVRAVGAGWRGRPEVLVPTVVEAAGLKVGDIGGAGPFCPQERVYRWYDARTVNWSGRVQRVPRKLHFPVDGCDSPLSASRIRFSAGGGGRMLFVAPSGGGAMEDVFPAALDLFVAAGADVVLVRNEDGPRDDASETGVRWITEPDGRWMAALRHLRPDAVAEYDHVFFWEADVAVHEFDPVAFARIMNTNRLSMAQPSLVFSHLHPHPIARRRPLAVGTHFDPEGGARPIVGRLTSFVDTSVSVFSRDGWAEFHPYLSGGNPGGFGYDRVPLPRKGIVDSMAVIRTADVPPDLPRFLEQGNRFLHDQGLLECDHVEYGWLFGDAVRRATEA